MACSTLRSLLIVLGALSLPVTLACKDQDECCEGADWTEDDGPLPTTDGSTTGTTTQTSTSTMTTTGPTSGSDSTATDSATDSAADSSTGPDIPVVCTEDLTCNPGEVCVLPCCGGPAPGCFQAPEGGDCGTDTPDVGGVRCCQNDPDPAACMMLQWCIPGPCMAAPPHCVTPDMLDCNGSSCSTEGCYGELVAGQLQCSCK